MLDIDTMIADALADELLDLEYPLLKRFKLEAPGTFRHSEGVMSHCEKVCRELGLNVYIGKLAGMYHDIGKMWAPHYFSENQSKTVNIHDNMDPHDSYYFLTSHVANTAAILTTQCPVMPAELIRIMSMHHGNSVLKSIASKVKDKPDYTEDAFRYKYSKPDNVYSGVLMICDTIEASVKAMTQAGKLTEENTPDEIIKKIDDLANDTQLDALTIGQVRRIKDVLVGEYSVTNKRINEGYSTEETPTTPKTNGNGKQQKKVAAH